LPPVEEETFLIGGFFIFIQMFSRKHIHSLSGRLPAGGVVLIEKTGVDCSREHVKNFNGLKREKM
jgi:hypothetical protein